MKTLSCLSAGGLAIVAIAGAVLLRGVSSQPAESVIKLCGRDFVRAVFVSCGGSRWKRYSPEENDQRGSLYRALLDSLEGSPLGPMTEEPETEDVEETEPESPAGDSATSLPQLQGQRISAGSSENWDEEQRNRLSSAFHVPSEEAASRSKRSAGLGKTCCKQGCTRSDIIRLC
ncbi:relaxin-3-like [Scyliorhinus canicula]|uniref:relaxin-3-like n=1 Tax=Scyliorhinus canicula TaxID=7830 RepID=UPI0018F6628B|nr:relaxin-3-like [Scyliorhinus canicula]